VSHILCLLSKASRTAGVYNSRQTGGSLHGTTFYGFCTVHNKTNYKNIYFNSKYCLGSSWRFFILQQLLRFFYIFTVIFKVVCTCSLWSMPKLTCTKTSLPEAAIQHSKYLMEELRSIKNYFSVLKVPKMYQGSITPDTRTPKYTIPVENWEHLKLLNYDSALVTLCLKRETHSTAQLWCLSLIKLPRILESIFNTKYLSGSWDLWNICTENKK